MKTNNQTFHGTIKHVDLEGGYDTLVTSSGEVYKLEGGSQPFYQDGMQVEVEGTIQNQVFGIGFGTPVLKIHHVKQK